jgi:hypothetical protein
MIPNITLHEADKIPEKIHYRLCSTVNSYGVVHNVFAIFVPNYFSVTNKSIYTEDLSLPFERGC